MDPSAGKASEPWAGRDTPVLYGARRIFRRLASRNTRFRLYFRMLDTPVLSELYIRGRGRLRHRRLRPGTRLVIEAFPSSGNTFCRQAFLLANPDVDPNDLCSHTHTPRVVERAVRAGVPCIVVARDPRDAVSSLVQRFRGIEADSAFAYYDHYYRKLLPIKDAVVVAPFSTVIADFSAVIEACNAKYGVNFVTAAAAGISNDMVLTSIEDRTRRKRGGYIVEATISRPSASRKPAAEFLQGLPPAHARAMAGAVDAYDRFVAGSVAPADG